MCKVGLIYRVSIVLLIIVFLTPAFANSIPPHAEVNEVASRGWRCSFGYVRYGDSCFKMTNEEISVEVRLSSSRCSRVVDSLVKQRILARKADEVSLHSTPC